MESPIGPLRLVATDDGLREIWLGADWTEPAVDVPVAGGAAVADPTVDDRQVGDPRVDDPPVDDLTVGGAGVAEAVLRAARNQLEAYFAGRRTTFDVPLAPVGSAFQRRVWAAVQEIPYGETESYGRLATRLGLVNGARAVGAANGQNPLPVVVPCHRVVGADGRLVGYGGGLDRKRTLLEIEARVMVERTFGG
jgi:methylated-DNA-[protein]-cysteine S-methyltransferase